MRFKRDFKNEFKNAFNKMHFKIGRNIYYHTIFGHILNRNNQKFMKLRKILKEYFI
jgi:hypothetical protein